MGIITNRVDFGVDFLDGLYHISALYDGMFVVDDLWLSGGGSGVEVGGEGEGDW